MTETTIKQSPTEAFALAGDADKRTKDDICSLILWEPHKREIYLGALAYVASKEEPASRFGLEEHMQALPQATTMHQPFGTLIDALVSAGALLEKLPDAEFDEDTQESFVDMSKASYSLTEQGEAALKELGPLERLSTVLALEPDFKKPYEDLIGFCSEKPRTRMEIDDLLNDFCAKQPNHRSVTAMGIYPSYFTDKLERAGVLVWKNGWTTTADASAFAAVFQ